MYVLDACEDQKRVSDPLALELQVAGNYHGGGWELNPGPLQEQPGLLTDEPSLQLPVLTAQNTVPFVYKELNQYLLGNAGIFISKKESYIFICIGYNNEWYEPLRSLKYTKTFLPNLHLYPSLVF